MVQSINPTQKNDETDGLPMPKRIWAVVSVGFALCMSVLDINIVNIVLPTLSHDFGTSPAVTTWIINGYQLAIVISLLSFSALGEIIGYRKVFLSGIGLFCITSLICALSDSFWTLTVARIFQGFSASAITSVNTAQLRYIYPKSQIGRGMGINAMVVAISAAAGPSVASGILSIASWHWLFAINVPIGLVAFVLSLKFLPRNPVKVEGQRFDVTSAVMNALTFGLLICVIDGFAHDIHWYILIPGFVIMLIIGWFFIKRQKMQTYPLLPVDLLRNKIFSLSLLTSVFSFIAQMLALVSIPFFFQRVLHLSEVATGLLLTPWPLATMITAPLAGRLMDRYNAGLLGGIGLMIFGTALLLLAMMPAHPSHIDIIWRMFLGGIGFGLFITPNNSTIIASAPRERSGGASGMLGMARLLGQTVGAAFVAVLFAMFPGHGMRYALVFGAVIAVVSAVISSLRLRK